MRERAGHVSGVMLLNTRPSSLPGVQNICDQGERPTEVRSASPPSLMYHHAKLLRSAATISSWLACEAAVEEGIESSIRSAPNPTKCACK
eukprot:2081998-Amphidinium_carterae.2